MILVSAAVQPAALNSFPASVPTESPIWLPLKPTNGAFAPVPSLMTSSEAMIGMPALLALSITCGPMAWSGTTMATPFAPCATAASSSVIALLASWPRLTTLSSTPSSFAFSCAPCACSTKYCWSPCFCR